MYQYSGNEFDFALNREGKPIEGFLGNERKAEVLFILKEPNNEDQPDFWFWNVVHDTYDEKINKFFRTKKAMKYYNTFSALARKMLNKPHNADILQSCAYMNMFPYNGKGWVSEGSGYRAMTERLQSSPKKQDETPNEKEKQKEEAVKNRIEQFFQLIDNFIESGTEHIVTVLEIYNILKKQLGSSAEEEYLEIRHNKKAEKRLL